jgi:D-alanyl-D-alanine carboxypeptidase
MKRLALIVLSCGLMCEAEAQPQRIRRGGGDDAELTKGWPKIAGRAASEAEVPASLAAYLESLSARDLFSGTVLLARGGEPVFSRSYGLADRERGLANGEATRYNVGSITKMFTRVALTQLRDAGKLDFDRPLRTYLPDYPSDIADKVTLRQLIDHRSGLGDIFGPEFAAARDRLETLADHLPLFAKKPLEFEPGTSQRYSNAGYIVLGLVIERVSGRTYYDYVRDNIFAPAGMQASGWYALDAPAPSRAVGYTSARSPGERRSNTALMPRRASSAGGSDATAMDLLRFVRALPKVLPRGESYRELMGLPRDAPADAQPAVGWAGGAPGVNALVRLEGPWELVVLSNYDPPAATEVGANAFRLLGLGEEKSVGRRGAPAPQ